MELNTHICSQLIEKSKEFIQITLDEDYIVRDNKPDVLQVIFSHGEIVPEEVKVANGNVWITGKMNFVALYQSDDELHSIDSVTGEIPFQEKLVMEGIEDEDEIVVDIRIEDLTIGIMNSRKLTIGAVLNVLARSLAEEYEAVACEYPKEIPCQQKIRPVSMLCLVSRKKEILHMSKEVLLPNAKGNMGNILFSQVNLRNREVFLREDGCHVEVEAQVMVLYRSESTGEYESYETLIPFSGEISLRELQGDEIHWMNTTLRQTLVEPRGDYDGEARMLGVELDLETELYLYREEECGMLEDIYSLEKEILPQRRSFKMNRLLMKNQSKARFMEQMTLEPGKERILQICGSNGRVTLDSVKKTENGILAEGIITVHLLYHTMEDTVGFADARCQIPFEQTIEMEGITEETILWLDAGIEQLQVNLMDSTEYEIRGVIQMSVLAMEPEEIDNIIALTEEELNPQTWQNLPGIIGCVCSGEDELWEIGKKYHVAIKDMIPVGDKVLVIKQVHLQ